MFQKITVQTKINAPVTKVWEYYTNPKHIVNCSIKYSMEDGRNVSALLTQSGEQTNIEVTFDAETENSIELQRQGWQAILDNFKSYVENK